MKMKNKKLKLILLFIFAAYSLFLRAYAEEKWKEKRSEHFIVYYKEVPEDFIADIIDEAEDYYKDITRRMGFVRYDFWTWNNRAKFYIYNDSEDYLKNTNQPSWSAGAVDYRGKIVKTYPQMSGFFDSLMPHEMGHIIFREFIGNKTAVPLWLEEGVASFQEKSKRLVADKVVRQAISNKKFIPLEELSKIDIRNTTDREQVELFYAEAVSVVNYLISEFGDERFAWFCRDLRDGEKVDEALWRFSMRGVSSLNKKWKDYLE